MSPAREVPFTHQLLDQLTQSGNPIVGGHLEPHEETVLPSDLRQAMNDALSNLTDGERDVLLLRFWRGLSFRAIQNTLGHKSVATTFRLYTTSLQKLRRAIERKQND